MINDTIAALSTAIGVGGVAVIRVSGDGAIDVAEKIFKPLGGVKVKDFEPYKMYVGEICGEGFTDFGMCVYFKAPKSFTGEDVVEFHSHGGIAIITGILSKIYSLGVRPATKGEYTKRAFLNGKMSLASCEGLIDMINSESVGEVKAGYYLYREKLTEKIKSLQSELTYALAFIDAGIDYPEEGVVEDNYDEIKKTVAKVKGEVEEIISRYRSGRAIKSGVKTALLGKPNTGKSSLLNRLLDYDKAIVSPVAGTTRDVVEGEIHIGGVRFFLSDTAGIRDSDDKIESVGVERAKKIIKGSDICVVVLDGSSDLTEEDENVLKETENENRIIVANKCDKDEGRFAADIRVSALTGEGIDELKEMLFQRAVGGKIDLGGDFLTEERHYIALKSAKETLEAAEKNFSAAALELIASDIKTAWDQLGEVSGETASESIIDEIFSKFCVGK